MEAAVKVDISVVSMEQEEQGRETSLEGRAALIHCHLTTVGRTPGEKKAQHDTPLLYPSAFHSYLNTQKVIRVPILGF